MGDTDALKRAAAKRSAEWIRSGMRLGLGTGSTIRFLLEELGQRLRAGSLQDVVGVPTSEATRARAAELGIPLTTLERCPRLDLTIDGADEVDPGLELVKGLGGALLREKIVAAASDAMVVVVDEGKVVERLGTRAPLPVEVDPFGAAVHEPFFRSLGARPELRRGRDGEPYVTDGGNLIYDCHFPDGIGGPAEMEGRLNRRPGVLENGLFVGIASHVVVASAAGVRVLSRGGAEG